MHLGIIALIPKSRAPHPLAELFARGVDLRHCAAVPGLGVMLGSYLGSIGVILGLP